MDGDVVRALQKAVHRRLQGIEVAGALTGATIKVTMHDEPADDQPPPFISIEGHEYQDEDSLDTSYTRHTVWLAIWSDYKGHREVIDIAAEIRRRLHQQPLAIDIGQCLLVRVRKAEARRSREVVGYHGIMAIECVLAGPDDDD